MRETPMTALNPTLYKRLPQEFGEVSIANEGEQFSAVAAEGGKLHVIHSGEYYCINCPYCRDTRKRLWINHMWGIPDKVIGTSHWWMAYCYNEPCLEHEANRKDLIARIYKSIGRERRSRLKVRTGTLERAALRKVEAPHGNIVPLSQLPRSHPANYYLANIRRFDPLYLEQRFGVGFVDGHCPDHAPMSNRIYIPVYMNGQLVSWQGRLPTDDADWRATPKYYGRRPRCRTRISAFWRLNIAGCSATTTFPF